ncbi:MAG: helix-hairpin-helix domain-containing protein [Phycisphaeraceae bacterium]|nr:MAG: helix-hairpin-helix domain-containing protein [Phycisphaeraceae bacterium]
MPDRPANTAISPARWAAAGLLGGASIVGMLWAVIGRAPAERPVPHESIAAASRESPPTPASGLATRQSPAPHEINATPAGSIAEASPPVTAEPPVASGTPDPASPPARPKPAAAPGRLNINTASAAELELLPSIGRTLAARIIEYRQREGPIRSLTQLMDVNGIGVRTAEAIEPYIRFE